MLTPRRTLVLGYAAALGASLSYGAVSVIGRKIVGDFAPPLVATSFSLLFGTVLMAAVFHRQASVEVARVPRRAWAYIVLAGCASTWGLTFLFLGLSKAPVVLVAPAAGTFPLVSVTLSYVVLRRLERVTWHTLGGVILVVAGVALVAVGSP